MCVFIGTQCVSLCLCVHMSAWGGKKTTSCIVRPQKPSILAFFFFFETESFLGLELIYVVRQGGPRGPLVSEFPSAGTTRMDHCAWLCNTDPGDQTQVLLFISLAFSYLIHLSRP